MMKEPAAVLTDVSWRERAACLPYPSELFFGFEDVESPAEKHEREMQAKSICASCEVKIQCLEYSLAAREGYGIWGGMTELERRAYRRSRALPSQ